MISFFRRALSSWLVLGLIGLVFVAIVITGVGTPGSLGDLSSSTNGEQIAKIGSQSLGANDVSQRLQMQLANERREQPGLDMGKLVRGGAVEQAVAEMAELRAMQAFGETQGMHMSSRLVDAELLDLDIFKGATGKFDRTRFDGFLGQNNMTERSLRADIERDIIARMIRGPASAGARIPAKLVRPYAALMLETRQGSVVTVPSSIAGVGAPPTAQELSAFYTRNSARYTVPETRIVRYALFDRARFEGKVTPSDAEISAYFNKNATRYGAKEMRGLTQVIVQSETVAKDIAAKVKAGGDLAGAAKAAGVEALTLKSQEKKTYEGVSSAAVAEAAFKGAQNAVVGPVKSGLGWHVIRVDSIATTAGTSLAAARPAIVAELSKAKVDEALGNFITEIEEAVSDGQTFEDVTKAKGLTVIATPAVTGSGIAPNDPGFKPSAELAPILKDAFQADPEDDPVVLSTTGEDRYAFVDLDRVNPSAPRPLASIAKQVTADFVIDRASREARKIADAIVAKANAGTPLAAAVAASGKGLRAPQPITARRLEVTQAGDKVPPPIAALFEMKRGKVRLMEAPDRQGWFIVALEKATPGEPSTSPDLIAATQNELSKMAGLEYGQQFGTAIKAFLKASTDNAAVQRLKANLSGAGAR